MATSLPRASSPESSDAQVLAELKALVGGPAPMNAFVLDRIQRLVSELQAAAAPDGALEPGLADRAMRRFREYLAQELQGRAGFLKELGDRLTRLRTRIDGAYRTQRIPEGIHAGLRERLVDAVKLYRAKRDERAVAVEVMALEAALERLLELHAQQNGAARVSHHLRF